TAWVWSTGLSATAAEAVAGGRGTAQADPPRKMRTDPMARRLRIENGEPYRGGGGKGDEELVPASVLRKGDLCVVEAGELIPGDGEVVEGIASVDESAITGESAPVIRESGGDRSAGTRGGQGPLRPLRRPPAPHPRRDLLPA